MSRDEAIDLAIDSLYTTLQTWENSPSFESVYEQIKRAAEVLNEMRLEKYPTQHAYRRVCKALEKYKRKTRIAEEELGELARGITPSGWMASKAQEILWKMSEVK